MSRALTCWIDEVATEIEDELYADDGCSKSAGTSVMSNPICGSNLTSYTGRR